MLIILAFAQFIFIFAISSIDFIFMYALVIKHMSKTRIYFVRHCEAEGNFYRLFHGHYDSKITQNGKVQLGYLAERFKDIPYDYIYSSPLNSTMLTAKAVNKYKNLDIIPYE